MNRRTRHTAVAKHRNITCCPIAKPLHSLTCDYIKIITNPSQVNHFQLSQTRLQASHGCRLVGGVKLRASKSVPTSAEPSDRARESNVAELRSQHAHRSLASAPVLSPARCHPVCAFNSA
jgi:hypothetical protein